jgi:transposase-like protein
LFIKVEDDILACKDFPQEHWKQIYSNNVLEQLNKEIRRKTNVVGIFPNEALLIRPVGAILQNKDDEWRIARRIR